MADYAARSPKIRVALIGLGMWGARAHLPAFADRADVDVVAIVEPNLAVVREPAARFGVTRLETDAANLFRDPDGVDAVVISTPDDTHRDLALAAFGAGMHVLCEKPLAYDLPQAIEMAIAATASGKVGKLGFLSRFSPVLQRMKTLVADGFIGDLQVFESHTVNAQFVDPERPIHWKMQRARANGGVSVEYGSHAIDLALWFGGPLSRVVGQESILIGARPDGRGGRQRVDVDDASAWLATYVSGGQASFQMGWASLPVGGGGVRLYGSRGSLAWVQDPTGRRSESLWAATLDRPEPHVLFEFAPPPEPRYDDGEFPLGLYARYNAGLVESFIADIKTGRATSPSFADGLAVQRVLAALRVSLDEARWAAVPHDDL